MVYNNWVVGQARLSSIGDIVSDDSKKATEYTEQYTVVMESAKDVANITTVSGIPSIGDKSTIDGLKHLRVCNIRFSKIDPMSTAWNIDVTYGIAGHGPRVLEAFNGNDYISVSWSVDEITSDICYDIDNVPVINSAGDPFDSLPQKVVFAPHITIVRRESTFPDLSLNGTVNRDAETILGVSFAKHCARLKILVNLVAAEKPYEVTYEIIGMTNIVLAEGYSTGVFEDFGWDIPMVECGYQFYDENGVLRKFTITDANGVEREVSGPQLLTSDGKDARGRNPHIKRIVPYREASWSSLNFPTNPSQVEIEE